MGGTVKFGKIDNNKEKIKRIIRKIISLANGKKPVGEKLRWAAACVAVCKSEEIKNPESLYCKDSGRKAVDGL